jgi:hypothetical protein
MLELQRDFILGFLMPFLTAAYIPLVSVRNNKRQRNDVPDKVTIFSEDKPINLVEVLKEAERVHLYSADKRKWLKLE